MAEYTGEIKPLEQQSSGAREYTGDVIPFGGQPETPKPDTGLGARAAQRRYREAITEGAPELAAQWAYEGPSLAGARRTPEQLGKEWTQAAIGGAASYPGIVGDIEALGRAGLGYIGAPVEPTTFFPTTERIGEKIAGLTGLEPEGTPAEIEQQKQARKAGELGAGLFGPSFVSKGLRALTEGLRPSIPAAKTAAKAEEEGLKVKAAQAKVREPIGQPLSAEEQIKVNRGVTKETGRESDTISPEFIQERLKSLGKQYDNIYKGDFQIDEGIAQAARAIASEEARIGAAGDAGVASIASNVARRWEAAKAEAEALARQQQIMQTIGKQYTAMRRGKGELVDYKFGPGERIDAPPLTRELLNSYGAGSHANVRPITAESAPAWAKDVNSVITELTDKLGLRVRPGVYVGSGAGSYGWAHPYGHIFLNENLLKSGKDALSTALHEFGHMVEFQLFQHAPPELKAAINAAWNEQKAASRGLTVEQLRPITAEKYTQLQKSEIPVSRESKEYYLGFKEWYAEQVSRWLTTKKEPTTIVEKFFKGIADAWKAIYAKVVGHTPLAKDVDTFMRSNWEGKLINENITQRILKVPETAPAQIAEPAAGAAVMQPIQLSKPVIAEIPGEELRRLRSYIADRAANHPDGNIRYQSRNVLNQIDNAIEKTNPNKARQLQDVNKKYRTTLTLQELRMAKDESALANNVSPEKLGKLLAAERSELSHPLSQYGEYGTALKMRSVTEGPQTQADVIRQLLSRGGRVARYLATPALVGPYDYAMRAIQRRMTPGAASLAQPTIPGTGLPARMTVYGGPKPSQED